ncbi:MAG: helix-turn-helix domain-containing protein [Mucilaginibacter sp.]
MRSIPCKMVVRLELEKIGLHCTAIEIGRVEAMGLISAEKVDAIKIALGQYGLELVEDKKNILIEKIKNVIIEMIHYSNGPLKTNFSDYLSTKLNLDYTYLSNIFSEMQDCTIEHFIIGHKIERVKELISYNDLNLTEISWKLHYSSVAHLSSQFKKVTGITASQFKQLDYQERLGLENM